MLNMSCPTFAVCLAASLAAEKGTLVGYRITECSCTRSANARMETCHKVNGFNASITLPPSNWNAHGYVEVAQCNPIHKTFCDGNETTPPTTPLKLLSDGSLQRPPTRSNYQTGS